MFLDQLHVHIHTVMQIIDHKSAQINKRERDLEGKLLPRHGKVEGDSSWCARGNRPGGSAPPGFRTAEERCKTMKEDIH